MRFRTCRPDSSDDRTSQLRDVFFDRSATLGKAEVLHAEDSADAIDYIDISPAGAPSTRSSSAPSVNLR